MEEYVHVFRDVYGCPVHWLGYSEREQVCSCRMYWKKESEVSKKAWREDHAIGECVQQGGACKHRSIFQGGSDARDTKRTPGATTKRETASDASATSCA